MVLAVNKAPCVSLAIPIYNEEAVAPELVRRTTAVLNNLPGGPHQIVFVDDGSSDCTLEILSAAAREDSRLLVVALSRNFGRCPRPRDRGCGGLDGR
jgi:polyisoprenyl-phosphate glycosyltransferase